MAQELVLIPKLKYEHLMSKSKNNDNEQIQTSKQAVDTYMNLQTSPVKKKNMDSQQQQHGGKISNERKKKLYVKGHKFNRKPPINKITTKNTQQTKTTPDIYKIKKHKNVKKIKWISYNV